MNSSDSNLRLQTTAATVAQNSEVQNDQHAPQTVPPGKPLSTLVSEQQLPQELEVAQAVDLAYGNALTQVVGQLRRSLPVLIECEKDLALHVFINLRARLRALELRCLYLDGRPTGGPEMMDPGFVGNILRALRDAVRGPAEKRVVVLPHLDLLTTSQGGLTSEAREVISLLYENPELVWLGFKDPSFTLPTVIENLFLHHHSLLGIGRQQLPQLVTQREARKFGRPFNPWQLYKYVSGVNAVRLRRLLSTLEGEDYPPDPKPIYQQIRQATLQGGLEIPDIHLENDLGGYTKVKQRLRAEILEVLIRKDSISDPQQIQQIESLIPRGMIFWGPPGTGKTLFAKAMASALGAAITIVSGPELKSRWVGESEERLRQIFRQARQSAPAIIVFDELDSFASARGTYTGSGVEHSMVNQLLTEMDGFHREELVFVIGTTNFVEILDPALLRPGRFEFHLHIPYPNSEDRKAILQIYNQKMGLQFSDRALSYAVKRTGDFVEGAIAGTRYSGDHINALCRALARIRLREGRTEATEPADIERAITEWCERPQMTLTEQKVVATHEAGHAVCSLNCEHAQPIERISIQGDTAGALGFVRYQDPAHRYVVTQAQLLDDLCILMGGREAERLFLDDISIGAAGDLERATAIARAIVEEFGLGGTAIGLARYNDPLGRQSRHPQLSETQLAALDQRVRELLEEARQRAEAILKENESMIHLLRDLLLEKKVIDAETLANLTGSDKPATEPSTATDKPAQQTKTHTNGTVAQK